MVLLLAGCGSIGRRHLDNLVRLGRKDVCVYDVSREALDAVQKQHGVAAAADFDKALADKPEAVLICTPTSTHVQMAKKALEAGCHVFVEKPISDTLEGVDGLERLAAKKGLVVLAACNLRFSSAVMRMKAIADSGRLGRLLSARAQYGNYLPNLRKTDYRKTYAASKALGGGIILDDVHEIDYLTWLMGAVKEVCCMGGKVSSLEMDAEDSAEVLLRFAGGAVAEVHMDYFQTAYQRTCELVGENGTLAWQDHFGRILLHEKGKEGWEEAKEKIAGYDNDMYVREMEHFLRCVEGREKPLVGIKEAKQVLAVALAAKEASRTGRTVAVR